MIALSQLEQHYPLLVAQEVDMEALLEMEDQVTHTHTYNHIRTHSLALELRLTRVTNVGSQKATYTTGQHTHTFILSEYDSHSLTLSMTHTACLAPRTSRSWE